MVSVGIIGVGDWGVKHLRIFKEFLDQGLIEDITIYDIDVVKAKKIAKDFSIKVADSYKSIISNSRIDAVSIVTPSNLHAKMVIDAIKTGKDVLVEKPLSTSLKEAEEVVRTYERSSDSIVMVGHIFRYHPAVRELKKIVSQGILGKLLYMEGRRLSFRLPREDAGVLFTLGVHEADIFCFLLNEEFPVEVFAQIHHYYSQFENIALMTMRFKENVVGYAFESWLYPVASKQRYLAVIGDRALAFVDYLEPNKIILFNRSIANGEICLNDAQRDNQTILLKYREPLKEELAHFIDCVYKRKPPLSDIYVGKRAVEIIEAALISARRRAPVYFSEYKSSY